MSKQEFWRKKLNPVPALNNPFRLKALEVSKTIIVNPSTEPLGYKRRISEVMWMCRPKVVPGDTDHIQVYIANKKIGTSTHSEGWEIVLYNASSEEVTIDVLGEEEEMIGTIDITP